MKRELRDIIYSDLYRYTGNTKLSIFLKNYIFNPPFRFICIFRKTNYYKNKNKFLFLYNKNLLRICRNKFGFQIPYTTNIDKGFCIEHFGRTIINPNAVIGKNVNISTGVTIGRTTRGKLEGSPTIGDEVWIGTNSVIVGNISIGNNVLIAPNSYVNRDIPSNSIVIGNPCKIIPNNQATYNYICNKI